ncbi:hypothetical protein RFI_01707, partial [Reticulomyxa filosa]
MTESSEKGNEKVENATEEPRPVKRRPPPPSMPAPRAPVQHVEKAPRRVGRVEPSAQDIEKRYEKMNELMDPSKLSNKEKQCILQIVVCVLANHLKRYHYYETACNEYLQSVKATQWKSDLMTEDDRDKDKDNDNDNNNDKDKDESKEEDNKKTLATSENIKTSNTIHSFGSNGKKGSKKCRRDRGSIVIAIVIVIVIVI